MEIEVTGAKILFELPFGITITETQVNMWIVMAAITARNNLPSKVKP